MNGISKQTKEAILERMKGWKDQYCNSDEYNDAREDCYAELKQILNSLPEIEAGVIFTDGEFVPIKDEELMQTIAEWLDIKEEKPDINISP